MKSAKKNEKIIGVFEALRHFWRASAQI